MKAMREVKAPTRGSGPVNCCGGHRDKCNFGRCHSWSTWYENGRLQRTPITFHCHICDGVCTGDEADYLSAAVRLAGELASFTHYPPEPNALEGHCAACEYELDAGEGVVCLGSSGAGTFAATLHKQCAADVDARRPS
jgi:hypothetical protein